VKGLTTQGNGDFSAEDLPVGVPLKLKATAVGYSEWDQEIALRPPSIEKDLGSLRLTPRAKELEQVVVTASKPAMSVDMDKKVFNVSKDIVSAGGSGLDVLKNVPSINVDIDGNISLRGGSPQIFVDGKPTLLTLDQIPADAIESVEVITNPSAKYHGRCPYHRCECKKRSIYENLLSERSHHWRMAFASETSPARSSGIENDIESQRVEQEVMRSMSAVGPCLFSEGLQTVIGWGGKRKGLDAFRLAGRLCMAFQKTIVSINQIDRWIPAFRLGYRKSLLGL